MMSDWQPTANLAALQARSVLYRDIRQFFAERNVMEVDVPSMSACAVTDPHIDSIKVRCGDGDYFLQTSPEFAMKRLLAAGSGAIYALVKAFRNGETGRRHNPEFTMLEWYRPGLNDRELIDEVEALIVAVLNVSSVEKLSYRDVFQRFLSIDPHTASLDELRSLAHQHVDLDWDDDCRDTWLDILISHVIEPQLGEGLMFIYDYPASQAALARVCEDERGMLVARRFEAFVGGIELTNGYWELTDAEEQARRFEVDLERRKQLGLPCYPSDQRLVAALAHGMPETAGVALGVDRLLMLQQGCDAIQQVIAFPTDRA